MRPGLAPIALWLPNVMLYIHTSDVIESMPIPGLPCLIHSLLSTAIWYPAPVCMGLHITQLSSAQALQALQALSWSRALQVQAGQPAASTAQSVQECVGRPLLRRVAAGLLHVQCRHADWLVPYEALPVPRSLAAMGWWGCRPYVCCATAATPQVHQSYGAQQRGMRWQHSQTVHMYLYTLHLGLREQNPAEVPGDCHTQTPCL